MNAAVKISNLAKSEFDCATSVTIRTTCEGTLAEKCYFIIPFAYDKV